MESAVFFVLARGRGARGLTWCHSRFAMIGPLWRCTAAPARRCIDLHCQFRHSCARASYVASQPPRAPRTEKKQKTKKTIPSPLSPTPFLCTHRLYVAFERLFGSLFRGHLAPAHRSTRRHGHTRARGFPKKLKPARASSSSLARVVFCAEVVFSRVRIFIFSPSRRAKQKKISCNIISFAFFSD